MCDDSDETGNCGGEGHGELRCVIRCGSRIFISMLKNGHPNVFYSRNPLTCRYIVTQVYGFKLDATAPIAAECAPVVRGVTEPEAKRPATFPHSRQVPRVCACHSRGRDGGGRVGVAVYSCRGRGGGGGRALWCAVLFI